MLWRYIGPFVGRVQSRESDCETQALVITVHPPVLTLIFRIPFAPLFRQNEAAVAAAVAAAGAVKGAKELRAPEKVPAVVQATAKQAFSIQGLVQNWPKPSKHLLAGAFSGGELSVLACTVACLRVSSLGTIARVAFVKCEQRASMPPFVRNERAFCTDEMRRLHRPQASSSCSHHLCCGVLGHHPSGVSKTATAPLEAIRIKLMVGGSGENHCPRYLCGAVHRCSPLPLSGTNTNISCKPTTLLLFPDRSVTSRPCAPVCARR
jgi:hypothetical protein